MATSKKPVDHTSAPDALTAHQAADSDLLLKRDVFGASPEPGVEQARPWGNFPTKEELRAASHALPPSGHPLIDDSHAATLSHSNPVPVADRKGVFVESGNSSKSRVNRSSHKP